MFSFWQLPDETLLLVQTVTPGCTVWKMNGSRTGLCFCLIAFFPNTETTLPFGPPRQTGPTTIQNGNIKHDLLHRSYNKTTFCSTQTVDTPDKHPNVLSYAVQKIIYHLLCCTARYRVFTSESDFQTSSSDASEAVS